MSASVFPARAGMSPVYGSPAVAVLGVPRASGDEPHKVDGVTFSTVCSPRERG